MLAFEPFAALALELCEYETDTDELFDTEVLLDKPVVELVLVELLALPELPFAGRLRGRGIRSARRARGTGAGSTTGGARRGLVPLAVMLSGFTPDWEAEACWSTPVWPAGAEAWPLPCRAHCPRERIP